MSMKIFISYAREDIEVARKLRADIEKAGIKTWLDKEDLLPGQKWRTVIRKEIRECSHFLALLSPKSLSTRGFVQKELKMALDMLGEFPDDEIFVIPVRIEECEPEDEQLQEIHWADLFPSYEKGLKQILSVLIPASSEAPKVSEKTLETALTIRQKSEEKPQPKDTKPKYQLRKESITVSENEFIKVFGLNAYWRPLEYIQNDFEDNRDGTITDHATGLIWEEFGSDNHVYFKDIPVYIEQLNRKKFAGYNDWRLPTIDELKSLITQEKQSNNLYISSIFEKKKDYNWFWSSDKRPSGGAWLVHFSLGSIPLYFLYDVLYVRMVRSKQ